MFKRAFILIFVSFLLGSTSYSYDEITLRQAINLAEKNSTILKMIDQKIVLGEAGVDYTKTFHLPELVIEQKFINSNNPVSVFSEKLMQQNFKMHDLSIDRLNKPSFEATNLTTVKITMPIFTFGAISNTTEEVSKQLDSYKHEKSFVKREIFINLYALYYSYLTLNDLKKFLEVESTFLVQVLKKYDFKTLENKNLFLSYNQGKIIQLSLDEAMLSIKNELNKISENASYIIGKRDIKFKYDSNDILDIKKFEDYLNEFKTEHIKRYDLKALEALQSSIDSKVEVEKAKLLPNIGAFAETNISTQSFKKSAQDATFGIALTWDFSLKKLKNKDIAQKERSLIDKKIENELAKINSEIEVLVHELLALSESISYAEKKHSLFLENKEILTTQYKKGSIELYSMLDNFSHFIENFKNLKMQKIEYNKKLIKYISTYKENL